MAWTYDEETQVYTVEVSEVENLLTSLPENDIDTPYKLEITQLTEEYVYKLSSDFYNGSKLSLILKNCKRYLDLSPTIFTQNIRYSKCFLNCDYLVIAPTFSWESEEPFFVLRATFYGCRNLKTIPNFPTINSTLDYTFTNCSSLTSAPVLPQKCNGIERCFSGCSSLISVPNLPEYGYPSISGLFKGCTNLKNVPEIKNNQITNAAECFEGCVSIENFPDLPDSIQKMNWCFLNCTQIITPPKIPANTTTMEQCFRGCTSLKTPPYIPESVINMEMCFYDCISLTDAGNIPSNIQRLYRTFYNSGILKTPILPDKIEYTDSRYYTYSGLVETFSNCRNLLEVSNFPKKMKGIGFSNCSSLTIIPDIPDNIEDLSFVGCSSLKNISTIPSSVKSINFSQCTSLEKIGYLEQRDPLSSFSIYLTDCTSLSYIGVENCSKELELNNYLEENRSKFHIPESVEIKNILVPLDNHIPFKDLHAYLSYKVENSPDSPYRLNVTELTEENVRRSYEGNTLGYVLDKNNDKYVDLKETVLPSVENMTSVFRGCKSLVFTPSIPNSVINMTGCFSGCESLTEPPVIPDSVTNMTECFGGCILLTTVPNIPSSVTNMEGCFKGCRLLTTAPNIPDSVTNMSECFRFCESLTTVPNIPKSVSTLDLCFASCASLKEINSWNNTSNTTILSYAFYNCSSLEYIGTKNLYTERQLENFLEANKTDFGISFDIQEVVQADSNTIPFADVNEYLSISPENTKETAYQLIVTDIGENDKFTTALSPNQTKFVDLSGTVFIAKRDYSEEFKDCSNLVSTPTIPLGAVNMDRTFDGCSLLTVCPAIPDTVSSMVETYKGCENITVGKVGKNVTDMTGCFAGCTSLKQPVAYPENVEQISGCYEGCSSLKTFVKIPDQVKDVSRLYKGCTSLVSVSDIPDGKDTYESMFEGCSQLETVYEFGLTYEELSKDDTMLKNIFKDCPNLQNIYINKPNLTQSESWRLVQVNGDDKSYKVYNMKGGVEFSGIFNTNIYDKLEVDGSIDETVISSEGVITDEIVENFFTYRKMFTAGNSYIDPTKPNFVLWAKDPNAVRSNILGGGGSSFVPSITQAEYDKLSEFEKKDGTFRDILDGKDDENKIQMVSFFDFVPIGVMIDFMGKDIPQGFLECDGTAISRTVYEDLFDVIGTYWGAGDGVTTFNLPNSTSSQFGVKKIIHAFYTTGEAPEGVKVDDNKETTQTLWTSFKTGQEINKVKSSLSETDKQVNRLKDAVEKVTGTVYSYKEQVIGKWVNNKPLYQITYPIMENGVLNGDWSRSGSTFTHKDLSHIDLVVENEAITDYGILTSYTSGTVNMSYNAGIRRDNKNTFMISNAGTNGFSGSNCYLTLKYTKTTDTGDE